MRRLVLSFMQIIKFPVISDKFPVVSLGIFSVVPSDKTLCPEVDSASENVYQGFLLG